MAADDRRYAQRHTGHAVLPLQRGGHGGDGGALVQHRVRQQAHTGGDAIVGLALGGDDGRAHGAYLLRNTGTLLRRPRQAHAGAVLAHGDAAHGQTAPQRDLGIAVLAHDIAVDHRRVQPHIVRDDADHAGGIQRTAGAEDHAVRQPHALRAQGHHHVHRIGHHHDDAVGIVLFDLGHHALHDLAVVRDHIQARLAGAAVPSCGDDDEITVRAVGILAHPHRALAHIGDAMLDVGGLAPRLVGVQINEYDLLRQITQRQGVGDGRAHIARAHDGHLLASDGIVKLSFCHLILRSLLSP